MSLGSVLGTQVYSLAGWEGVVALATVAGLVALAIRVSETYRLRSAALGTR